jgi:hypothetical protein
MHPFGSCPRRAGAMTVNPGTGLLSQVIEHGGAVSCGNASSPGACDPPPLAGRTGAGGVGEQVAGAGEELAADRGGGDLLAAAAGQDLVAWSEVRVPLGGLRGLAQHPPRPGRALLGDVPVVDGAVAAADGGGKARPRPVPRARR